MVNLLIYLVGAAVIACVVTDLMHRPSNLLINIGVAMVGALLAGYLFSPIFKVGTINEGITLPTLLFTLLGSIILIGSVHLFQRANRGRRR